LATTIVPGTAIQKIVDVSIKDTKTFSEKVFFLELWPIEKATENTIEVKDEGKKLTGAFELIQFKFDKNNNFIYTSSDVNQKATYAGTASGFSISGFSAGAVIRIGKTNSTSDVIEQYKGPAESVEVKVSDIVSPFKVEIPQGQGIIDSSDGIKILSKLDPKGPTFSLRKEGLEKMELDCDGHKMDGKVLQIKSRKGRFQSTGKTNYTSRSHARINDAKQIEGLKKAQNEGSIIPAPYFRDLEMTVIAAVKGIKDKEETHSLKFGGKHEDKKELALSNSLNLPYFDKKQGGKGLWAREKIHPKYIFKKVNVMEGVEFPGNGEKPTGLKGIRYNINNNKGVHYEFWFDADPLDENGNPRNNWVKAWEYEDTSDEVHNFGVKDVTYRVDMADSVDIHAFNVRAILPP